MGGVPDISLKSIVLVRTIKGTSSKGTSKHAHYFSPHHGVYRRSFFSFQR